MSVFPLPVHFTENKTDESPNNTGKAKSYPDDGGIRHFLLPENQKTATAENRNIVSEVLWDFYMDQQIRNTFLYLCFLLVMI